MNKVPSAMSRVRGEGPGAVVGLVLHLNQASVDVLVQYARYQCLVREPLLDRGHLEMNEVTFGHSDVHAFVFP